MLLYSYIRFENLIQVCIPVLGSGVPQKLLSTEIKKKLSEFHKYFI